MIDFRVLYKDRLNPGELSGLGDYDLLVSSFNLSERVSQVFDGVRARRKIWMVCQEYALEERELPTKGELYRMNGSDEAEAVIEFFSEVNLYDFGSKRILVDCTGIVRPQLMVMLLLFLENGFNKVDIIYSEPTYYSRKERTVFSGDDVVEVRPICGFEGSPVAGQKEHLVLGGGYESHLLNHLSSAKGSARKTLILGFPPNRPEMYQESVLCAQKAVESLGAARSSRFWVPASANDPFHVANTLGDILHDDNYSDAANVYLAPVGPKPQALGFFLYSRFGRYAEKTAMLYPFTNRYGKDSAKGFTRAVRGYR